jgi:hypothetical protein
LEERLTFLDSETSNLRVILEQKVDIRSIKELMDSQEENTRLLQQKADQRLFNYVKSTVANLEKIVATKSDQLVVDELGASLQRAAQTVAQKADLSYLNRTNGALQKLTQASAQHERQIVGLTAAKEALDAQHIPQSILRTKDMLTKTSNSLKQLQDVVAAKASQNELEEVLSLLKDLDCTVSWKAGQQSVVDLSTAIQDLKQQLCLKADLLGLEEARADLQRTRQQVALKTDHHQLHELSVSLQSTSRLLSQKVDDSAMTEAKTRLQTLEAATENKASHQALADLNVELSKMREAISAQKIAVRRFSELEEVVGQLNTRMLQRADVETVASAENMLEELRQNNSKKAEFEVVTQQFQEMGKRLEFILQQLQLKVDKSVFDESLLPLQACIGEHYLSPTSVDSGSTLSVVTTNSSRSLAGVSSASASKGKSTLKSAAKMSPRVGRQSSQKPAAKL